MQVVYKSLGMLGITSTVEQPSQDVVRQNFADHLAEYGISYGTQEEYNFRFQIYHQNDIELNRMNADPNATFEVGHNQFSTMTEYEFKKFLGKRQSPAIDTAEALELDESVMAGSVDWRTKNVVNKVQNQGQCGSCWAFSTTAVIESADAIKTGNLKKLSEQHMVDCDTSNYACNGGLEIPAMRWAQKNPMALLTDYPYVARKQTCRQSQVTGKVAVSSYRRITPRKVSQVKAAVNQQPTCVSVHAGSRAFQMYRKGILNDRNCGNQIDHAVTAVGYGTENGLDYLIVRNSWGASWGEQGHIRMAIDRDGPGICGLLEDSAVATTK